jgi:arylsulfatase A-like enzyme
MRLARKRFRPLVVAVLAAAVVATVATVPRAVPAKPNVVVIMTDDQTVEEMRVLAQTKALIADAGVTFDNSFSSFPLCCPSRSTFLTGQYAHNHGVLENEAPTGGYYRLNSENTLPVWLSKAGYTTIHVGKYLNAYGSKDPTEVPPGWSDWHSTIDPYTYQMWGYKMNDNGIVSTYGDIDVEDPALYQTDVFRAKAISAIQAHAHESKPFFMTFWTLAPHREVGTLADQSGPRPAPRHAGAFANEPLPKPPSFNEKNMNDKPLFMRAKPLLDDAAIAEIEDHYRHELASLLAVDEAVAAIMDTLQAEGILDNTYVIFTSDNGYFHGEHRTPDEKILGYENSARVPLFIRGPGIAAGRHVKELVANVDLAPTILKLTGAEPGLRLDGRSLMPFVRDPSRRTRRPVLLEAFMPVGSTLQFFTEQLPFQLPGGGSIPLVEGTEGRAAAAVGPDPFAVIPLGKAVLPYEAIRTDRYVYFEYVTGEHELYDLKLDPWQIQSRHRDPAYGRTQLALALALEKLRLCRGWLCRADTPAIPNPA